MEDKLEKIKKENKTLKKIKKSNEYSDNCLTFTLFGLVVSTAIFGFVVYFEVTMTSKLLRQKKASTGRVPYLYNILREEKI